ncbi:MAG: hypothetical protein RLZZ488_2458 [Pseudomonadota bacterium]|jgi:SAM-dependent methyltransferase
MRALEDSINSELSTASGFLDRMQFFYELFPYPNRPFFLRPDPEGSIESHAGFARILAEKGASMGAAAIADLHLRDVRHAFANNKKIALVGCGTDEPLLFRLLHPHNPIVGIDLSLKSLRRAQRKIGWHRLRPVRLIHGDACAALGEEGLFSHIQCFGVLHHQPQPQKMMSAMAQSLELDGTLRLMIYSRTGRRLERGLQKKFLSLWGMGQSAPQSDEQSAAIGRFAKYSLFLTSLKLLLWRMSIPLLARKTLSLRFRYVGFSLARIADAFLHPSDHPLGVNDVLNWAEKEGLQLIAHEAKSYDLGTLSSHSSKPAPVQTLVSEEERGNISSNIVLVFRKVGAGEWISR